MKKAVIITGGTSGYGLATAKIFKEKGYIGISHLHKDSDLFRK